MSLVMTAGAACLALIVTLLVLLVVVPVAVLVPLAIVALALVGVLLVVAGAAALLFSPVILALGVAWLIWRLARGPHRRDDNTPRVGATIAR
jgi:membrane protein implicated in regulation of membrane protease activity